MSQRCTPLPYLPQTSSVQHSRSRVGFTPPRLHRTMTGMLTAPLAELSMYASRWSGQCPASPATPCLRVLTCLHRPLIGFALAGAGDIGALLFAERKAAGSLRDFQRIGH